MNILKRGGFTIVELLMTIVVIGIIAGIIIVSYSSVTTRTYETTLKNDLRDISLKLETYKSNQGGYPASLNDLSSGTPKTSEGLTYSYQLNPNNNMYCASASSSRSGVGNYRVSPNEEPVSGACISSETSIVGWWKLNGDAGDSSGNEHTGTVSGATLSPGQSGRTDGAYTFAGTTTYIALPESPVLNTAVFTMSAWIRPTSTINSGTIIGSSTINGGVQFRWNNTQAIALLKQNVVNFGPSTGAMVSLNNWWYVAVTYDSAGNYAYYINGTPSGSGNNVQTFTFANYQIGRKHNGSAESFNGSIDDVRIYDRVLTPSEIQTVYNAGAQ